MGDNRSIFLEKASVIHGDKYDYSKVTYKNSKTDIAIVCRRHREFKQTPHVHIVRKSGCKKCGEESARSKQSRDTDYFIKRSREAHGDEYDYSESQYVNCHTKVKIRCKKHGYFFQCLNHHARKNRPAGCPGCAKNIKTTEQFIGEAKLIHRDKYGYSFSDYINKDVKIKIMCPEHGIFEQTPNNHVNNEQGCRLCQESKGEARIAKWLFDRGIQFRREVKIPEFSKFKHFDFFVIEHNVYIEYDGIQHFKPSFKVGVFERASSVDRRADRYCESNGIRLERITYLENIETKLIGIFDTCLQLSTASGQKWGQNS